MTLQQLPLKDIFIWSLGLLTLLLSIRLNRKSEKIKSIENQLSDKKYKMYIEIISVFYENFYKSILAPNTTDEESHKLLVERMVLIKRDMVIYAPDKIFRKFTDWLVVASENTNDTNNGIKHFRSFYELLILIRKDMGNESTKLSIDDILLSVMQNRHELELFKKIAS